MPVQFLTPAEHEQLNQCPDKVSPEELNRFFWLTPADHDTIRFIRHDYNRLGFALQLGSLRYLGFFPANLPELPQAVVQYVAAQLAVEPELLTFYGKRGSTQRQHQRQIQTLVGYRRATQADLKELEAWLMQRALEHDKPTLLFTLACEFLKQKQIVRPGTTRLAHKVSKARHQAQLFCHQALQPLLNQDRCTLLDQLLVINDDLGRTRLSWLQRTPTGDNPKQILETLDKIAFLHQHQVERWDLSALPPNRINHLAKIGARATNQYLQRANETKRYPILLAFLKQSLYNFTDDLIEMVDQRIWRLYREAKRTFEQERLQANQKINEKLQTLYDLGQILLDAEVDDDTVRKKAFESISQAQLQTVLSETKQLIRPEHDAYVDYFGKAYNRVRHFSNRFLATLQFQAREDDQGLLKALQLVREIHTGQRRKLPEDAPTDFVPESWKSYVIQPDGIDRRYYELAALWVLRQLLRSGAVYLPHSRRFSELESYFIPKEEWALQRDQAVSLLGTPLEPEPRLVEREAELLQLIGVVDELLNNPNGGLREEKEILVLSPIEADERSSELTKLANTIASRLPQLDITDLLIEVDSWTHFSDALEHLSGSSQRDNHLLVHLYGCLLAQACNLKLKQMATSAELSYAHLNWCNSWYIRDDTLREANTALINYHYHQPLSQLWGGGMLSSSDGQRFPVKGSVRQGRTMPRYFGYGKGVTFYSWTGDQFSQYGSKVIPTTARDATYVLDEILNNETELPILEHTTDTAGYTELVFALFDLLGLRFSPRIRDLADQQLYRTKAIDLEPYSNLKKHILNTIQVERIHQHWDDMLRLAGSLKQGWVTASLIIQKLQAFPRQHPLTRALQEYGRLIKTIHILRWYADEANRRRLNRQLNKGEALHSLRTHFWYANQGDVREQQDEQLHNQVGCLNLVTNAVVVWNTVYIEQVVQQLKQEGQFPGDEVLKQIWPTRHAHINIYGRHHFDQDQIGKPLKLRELRSSGFQP